MYPRTRRQKEILNFIGEFTRTRGHQPSYQEIADHFRLASKGAVARHIEALERQGFVSRRLEDGAFSLVLNPSDPTANEVCELSWIDLSEFPDIDPQLLPPPIQVSVHALGVLNPEKICAFKVENDAMLGDHICEGDIAILEKRSLARDGEIVLAVLGGRDLFLQRLFKRGGTVELHPSNPKYEKTSLPSPQVQVCGVFRGLIRPSI